MAKRLWQPPRLHLGEEGAERRATWLELFYDLIFVVAIAQLAHDLDDNLTLPGLFSFIFLFIPVWWSWVGATFYATRFDTDDLGHRLFTLLQMSAVAALAVNVHHGIDKSSIGFALSYVAVRSILIIQYLNAGYFVPVARPLIRWYASGFAIGAGLWLISIFVTLPWRIALWGIGLIIDFGTPLTAGRLVAKVPPSFTHVPERIGLFTIIVLGESIAAVVRGVGEKQWGFASALTAFLGLSIAFSLWWIYFDTVDGSPLRSMQKGKMGASLVWLYSHLPLAIGLTATGVGVERLLLSETTASNPARWLICGAVASCLGVLALVHWITCTLGARRRKVLSFYRLGSAAFILAIALFGRSFSPAILVFLVAFACAVQVVLGLLGSLPLKASTDPDSMRM